MGLVGRQAGEQPGSWGWVIGRAGSWATGFCFMSLPLHQLLQLWEKNGYFDDSIIQQLQSPALGLGQYQVSTTQQGPFLTRA